MVNTVRLVQGELHLQNASATAHAHAICWCGRVERLERLRLGLPGISLGTLNKYQRSSVRRSCKKHAAK